MICGQKKRPFVIAGIVNRSSRTKICPTENIDPGRLDLIPELINQTTSPGLLCGTDHVDMAVSSRSRTLQFLPACRKAEGAEAPVYPAQAKIHLLTFIIRDIEDEFQFVPRYQWSPKLSVVFVILCCERPDH